MPEVARTSSATRLVCLLGHPVGHSVSPQIHSAAFAAAGIDAAYLAFDIVEEDLDDVVRALAAMRFLGANVTVPHKRAVWSLLTQRTPEAEAVGAANTLYWQDGILTADNTDATGLVQVLSEDIGLAHGSEAVIFGAGGAARATAVALGRLGAAVHVAARRPEAAAEVAQLARRCGAALVARPVRPRLVVNATPLGMNDELLPGDLMALESGQVALDLVYRREPTPFLRTAAAGGAATFDGLGMLVAQAARSFERWTGQQAPVGVMEAAAREALRRS